jgi:pyruvate/2-oxoglutarate dehydrogenase complex dihydrolipoamide dehydrogenase (E3) component
MSFDFHTAVVGSGSGGLTVAVGLSKLGKTVALIEKHHVGGDCTNVGCIPSKALIHGAKKVKSGGLTAEQVLQRVRERRDHLRDEETEWVQEIKNLSFLRGHARFTDSHTLRLSSDDGTERTVTAKNIVLATGSRPRSLELEGLSQERLLTNETMFEERGRPAHLAIVGGGVIGLEMAFAFRNLGSRVSLIHRGDRVLKVSEPEVSELLHERLEEVGVELYLAAEPSRFEESSQSLKLVDGRHLEAVDRVLVAAGRVPNLDLDLDTVGVQYDRKGIATDRLGRASVPNIYAIGDINHRSRFTHSANHQGRRLVKKLVFPFLPNPAPEPYYPSATFTDPEVAQVGPALAQLKTMFRPELIKTEFVLLKDTDRGYTMGIEHGFVMIHALAVTGRVLSATVVGPAAGEMISLLTFCVTNGLTMYKLADLVFPYPVLSEAVKKASDNFVFGTLGSLHTELYRYLRYRWARPE